MPSAPPLPALTPEQWQQAQNLFLEALDLGPEARAARLAACDDATVRREVEAMLAADAAPPTLLHTADALTQTFAGPRLAVAPRVPARQVGPYRIVREVGRGGMGTVYLAEREDVQKRVALKLVRGGLAAPEAVRRFLFERRVLARLDHPSIAALLDAGFAEDGAPYFAMEYVEGESITEACARSPVEERLRRFLTVCEAVAYAHRNLVVHRDLKPSNILVTPEGQVKLLDFGIAKLLEEEAEEGLTRTGARIMTPEYAAPEQVRGEAVTTATDVWALGILLCELLTGRRPFTPQPGRPGELERQICETDPARPSTAVLRAAATTTTRTAGAADPAQWAHRLAGDLDTIVLKALHKEPAQRYASVELLAEDLRRHLDGQPVLARPQTAAYRLRKFVRRHRAGVTTAAAVLTLIAGLVGFFLVRLAAERDAARIEARKAEQVSAFLVELFDAADPFAPDQIRGDTMTARTLVARGAERIETELADQPEIRAALLHKIGQVYTQLGMYPEAESLLRRSLAVQRAHLGARHPEVTVGLNSLGTVALRRGDAVAADSLFREALALNRALYGTEHPEVAVNLNNLGKALEQQGRFKEAEALFREALAMAQRLHGDDDAQMAAATSDLASVLLAQSRFEEAEALFRRSLALTRVLHGDDHPDVVTEMNNLAHALFAQSEYGAAERLLREVLDRNRGLLGEAHPYIAFGYGNLAAVLGAQRKHDEAVAAYRQAVAIGERTLGAEHPHVVNALMGLGSNLNAGGNPAEAEPLLREALARFTAVLPEGHPMLAWARNSLGICLAALGRFEEAERLLTESHAALVQTHGATHYLSQKSFERLVALYEAWDRPTEAARWRQRLQAARLEPAPTAE